MCIYFYLFFDIGAIVGGGESRLLLLLLLLVQQCWLLAADRLTFQTTFQVLTNVFCQVLNMK